MVKNATVCATKTDGPTDATVSSTIINDHEDEDDRDEGNNDGDGDDE